MCLKMFFIVDFACSGFLTTRIIAYLEVADFVPGMVNIGNDIAFLYLLVVDVKQDFTGGDYPQPDRFQSPVQFSLETNRGD